MKFYGPSAIAGMFWSWVGSAGIELMWLPTAMITARLLTPQDFGIVAAATFFLSLATRLTQFGFNAAILRMKDIDEDHKASIFVMTFMFGVVAWLLLTLSAPMIAAFFRSPATGRILPVAALSFLIVPMGTVPNALLARELRYREITYVNWLNAVTSSASTIVLAWWGFGYWSLVYGQLAAAVTSTLAKILYARWWPRLRFRASAVREALSFGSAIYALRLVEYGALNLDSMVVGRTMGMSTLGFYDKAFNLMSRVIDRLNQAGPAISFRVFAAIQDEPGRFRRGYRKVMLSTALVGYPAMTILAFSAVPLFEVLFGKKWVGAALPFQILCAAGALKVLNGYAASVVEAAGRVWAEVWRQTVYVLLIVGGVAALSPWGTPGAAIAVLLATVVMTLLIHHLLLQATSLTLGDVVQPQLPGLICCAGTAATTWIAREVITYGAPEAGSFVRLLVLVTAGACFCAAFIRLTPSPAVRELRDDVVKAIWPEFQQRLGWTRRSQPRAEPVEEAAKTL